MREIGTATLVIRGVAEAAEEMRKTTKITRGERVRVFFHITNRTRMVVVAIGEIASFIAGGEFGLGWA